MPTNDERREVAARLREFEQLRAAFKDSSICAFSDALGVGYMDWEHICARLADLMEPEERTCHDVSFDSREFVCSWCGCHIDVLGIESEPTMWLGGSPIEPSFCPNCGAKVVGE